MGQTTPFEMVTRLEAAERQLRVAIRMFFERKDMIAVHTLAAAALQILDDLVESADCMASCTLTFQLKSEGRLGQC